MTSSSLPTLGFCGSLLCHCASFTHSYQFVMRTRSASAAALSSSSSNRANLNAKSHRSRRRLRADGTDLDEVRTERAHSARKAKKQRGAAKVKVDSDNDLDWNPGSESDESLERTSKDIFNEDDALYGVSSPRLQGRIKPNRGHGVKSKKEIQNSSNDLHRNEDTKITNAASETKSLSTETGKAGPSEPDYCASAIRYFRLRRTGLWTADNSHTPATLAAAHFGLQAQEETGSILGIWNRLDVSGPKGHTQKSLVDLVLRQAPPLSPLARAWGQRTTLHLYAMEDWCIASAAARSRAVAGMASTDSRIPGAQEAVDLVCDALSKELSAGRAVSTALIDRICEKFRGNSDVMLRARRHPFLYATLDGWGSRVSSVSGKDSRRSVIVPRSNDVPWRRVGEGEALRIAATRYFNTYGPALETDFRYFMGITASMSRAAVNALIDTGEVVDASIFGKGLLVGRDTKEELDMCFRDTPPRDAWPVRLLGRFDPYLLAHKNKTWLTSEENRKRIWTLQADILPTVVVHGLIRGRWEIDKKKDSAAILIFLFGCVNDDEGLLSERELELLKEEGQRLILKFWEKESAEVRISYACECTACSNYNNNPD